MLNEKQEIEEIINLVTTWLTKIEVSNRLNYYDINKASEGVCLQLLNLVYNYNLKDVNEIRENHPGIDLGDFNNFKVAFQVTSQTDIRKIKKTLKVFNENKLHDQFPGGIKFFILSHNKIRANKDIKFESDFDIKRDVLYPSDVIKRIKHIYRNDVEKFKKIKQYLQKEFGPVVIHPESDLLLANQTALFEKVKQLYLKWLIFCHSNIELRGIKNQGRINVPIEHVFIALKVDRTHPYERVQKGLALERDLIEIIHNGDFLLEQREAALWYLVAGSAPETSPIDIFSTNIYQNALLTFGEAYQQNEKLVILGDPGSGKTTLARWLTFVMARAMLSGNTLLEVAHHHIDPEIAQSEESFLFGKAKLPILIRISEYAEDRLRCKNKGEKIRSLIEFIGHHSWLGTKPEFVDQLTSELLNKYIVTQIKANNALIVLDGLDEIPYSNLRDEVLLEIHSFIENWVGEDAPVIQASLHKLFNNPKSDEKGNKLLVTSRIVGYYAAHLKGDITHLTIEPMRDTAVDRFCEAWMQVVHEKEFPLLDQDKRTDLITNYSLSLKREIHSPKRIKIRALASNPLLCGIIATVFYNGQGHLPQQRVILYETVIKSMIDLWNLRMEKLFGRSFNEFEFFSVLEPIADYIHENIPTGLLPENKLTEIAISQLAASRNEDIENPSDDTRKMIESFIRILREDVGLLAARGHGVYGFLHLTFQEYFAARYLSRFPDQVLNNMVDKLENPRWKEPLKMSFGYMSFHKPIMFKRIVQDLLKIDRNEQALLPRSAILITGSLQEIENFSDEDIYKIIDILINAYANWELLGKSTHFQKLIENAFAEIALCGFGDQIERAFLGYLNDSTENRRLVPAIASVIDHNELFSTPLLRSLIISLPADSEAWEWSVHAALRKAVTPPDPEPPPVPIRPAKDFRLSFYEQQRDQTPNETEKEKIAQLITQLIKKYEADIKIYEEKKAEYDRIHKEFVLAEVPLRCQFPTNDLPFRRALEKDPKFVSIISTDADWLRICIALYGGLEDYQSSAHLNEYYRISAFLQLGDNERKAFEILFRDKWHFADPVYHMAVYLDQYGPRSKALADKIPNFSFQAIYKDSPLTPILLSALASAQKAQSLIPQFIEILSTKSDISLLTDSFICLLILGYSGDNLKDLCCEKGSYELILTAAKAKLSQISFAINDPVTRASGHILTALIGYDQIIPSYLWREVVTSILSVILPRQPIQLNMLALLQICPTDQIAYVHAEHLAQKVLGFGDDVVYVAAQAADLFEGQTVTTETVLNTVKMVANTQHLQLPIYQFGWPIEKFPPYITPDGDIPISVLNNISRIHQDISFVREALLTRLRPIIEKNPELLPETMLINLLTTGVNDIRSSTLLRLHPELNDYNILGVINQLGNQLVTPFFKARYLLRLIEFSKVNITEQLSNVIELAGDITDTHQKVQIIEWVMRLDKGENRDFYLQQLMVCIPLIPDALNQIAAYFRLLNILPENVTVDIVKRTIDLIELIKKEEIKAELLSSALLLLQYDKAATLRLTNIISDMQDTWCQDKAMRKYGSTMNRVHTLRPYLSDNEPFIWSPIILAGQIQDSKLIDQQVNHEHRLWEPTLTNSAELNSLISYGLVNRLKLTAAVAKNIDQLFTKVDKKHISKLLSLLEHPEPDALLIVKNWVADPNEEISAYAALYVAEISGISEVIVPRLLKLLESTDDLSRHRVSRLIRHPLINPPEPTKLLSAIGLATFMLLLKEVSNVQDSRPHNALTIRWMFQDLLIDDLTLFEKLVDDVEFKTIDQDSAAIGISNFEAVVPPVWYRMLDAIKHCRPKVQFLLMVSICRMAYKKRKNRDVTYYRLNEEQWVEFLEFKDAMLKEKNINETLDDFRINVGTPMKYISCVQEILKLNEGTDPFRLVSPIQKLMKEKYTSSFFEILSMPNENIRKSLEEVASSNLYAYNNYTKGHFREAIMTVYKDVYLFEALLSWLYISLEKSVKDEYLDSTIYFLLVIIAETVESFCATFTNWKYYLKLRPLLIQAAEFHNSYPGRAAAIKILSNYNVNSEIIDVLKVATRDVYDVQNAAFETASKFRHIDTNLFPELMDGLYDESAMTAFTFGRVLTALGGSDETSPKQRRQILKSLTEAAQHEKSKRLIHFNYTDAVLPEIPRLDDEFLKMGMQVAGLN